MGSDLASHLCRKNAEYDGECLGIKYVRCSICRRRLK